MTRLVPLAAAFVAVMLSACADETHSAVIAPQRAPCNGSRLQLCLLVAEDGGAASFFYQGIEGYAHEWGVETRLSYRVSTVDNPPEDGSSLRYELEAINRETSDAAGTTYSLAFPSDGWFESASGGLQMLDTTVACDPALCADILARTADYTVTFELRADPAVPLRAIAVQ